ncbi:oxidoreductase [Photobacterium aquae]|uniref:Oxidoreductase n=1 Tax=Photobacterium aquae TaxID=1195763 RepID=A0A0J1H185_9GAMM|nr:oxidoreductase [Photobacterium aquae]KLV05593.1 oxidoreductase [Photobacterium aquae]
MSTPPIKTAVIGYGFSAQTFHLPFIVSLPEFELVAISSSKGDRVSQDYPSVCCYSTAESLICESDAELVIITAPNDVHFALAELALRHNKHVVIEKPFVTKVADGQALITLAAEKGLVLSVYHNRRWDGDFLTVKSLVEAGKLGDVKCFESHFDRFRPQVRQRWRELAADGGGILFDLGPHLLDQALALFGLPEAITAQCLITRDGATTVDYVDMVLHYPNMIANLHADLHSAGPNRRFTVKGSKGTYEKQGLDPQEDRLKAGVLPVAEDWADEIPEQYGRLYTEEGVEPVATERGGYQHYFRAVAKAIRHGEPVPVSAEDALWNIRLIEMALESSQSGKTVTVTR